MTEREGPRPVRPRAEGPLRVVVIAPVLPFDAIPHAGGVYLQRLHQALVKSGGNATFLVQDNEFNRSALREAGSPERSILLGQSKRRTSMERLAMRVAWTLDPVVSQRRPTWPPLPVVAQLVLDPAARAALRSADVIDVQWPEFAWLLPIVRALNVRARRIATLHDVLSQRWDRRARAGADEAKHAERAARSARRLERYVLRLADTVVVFSDKDRDLLPSATRATVEVVNPPLAPSEVPPRRPSPDHPTAVFVSMLNREENNDAALWLVREIWPLVVQQLPDARLRIVGMGASDELVSRCQATRGVEVTGFVTDLGQEYSAATACVIPLRSGAGVKFKAIDALVAGVPTVTTTIGAEGIGGDERFALVSDEAGEFAEGLVKVLRGSASAEGTAEATQVWARARYGHEQFERHIESIYGTAHLNA